jgi:hypothetical protein
MKPCTHFVGFRKVEYNSAVKIFGEPDFFHRIFDIYAKQEIIEGDTVVFANSKEVYSVFVRPQ